MIELFCNSERFITFPGISYETTQRIVAPLLFGKSYEGVMEGKR